MPSYKLSYFNSRGRAEVARYMFKMTDTEFEDHRIEMGNWPEWKPKMPFEAMPVLEVDGVQICQTSAIERLLAKRMGLYGASDMEQAKSDMVVGCCDDFLRAMFESNLGTDEEKAKQRKKFMEETGPTMLVNFEKMVSAEGFFIGKEIMWCDLVFAHMLTFLKVKMVDMADFDLSKYPKLTGIQSKVENHPKIAAWIKVRPETDL